MTEQFMGGEFTVTVRDDLVEPGPYLFTDPVFIGESYDVATGVRYRNHAPDKNGQTCTVIPVAEEEQSTCSDNTTKKE